MDNQRYYENFNWEQIDPAEFEGKINQIKDLIPDNVKTIIDVGCGNGIITNALAENWEVTGVDRSANALKHVKTNKIQCNCHQIPVETHSFDLLLSSEMIEHLDSVIFDQTVGEFNRIAKRYILITVPNQENINKMKIQCPHCKYVYNRSLHFRSFDLKVFENLFMEYNIIKQLEFGRPVRSYNQFVLKVKQAISSPNSWLPTYWIKNEYRHSTCPKCERDFTYPYKFNFFALACDIANVIISPKKPYWLFVLLERKNIG